MRSSTEHAQLAPLSYATTGCVTGHCRLSDARPCPQQNKPATSGRGEAGGTGAGNPPAQYTGCHGIKRQMRKPKDPAPTAQIVPSPCSSRSLPSAWQSWVLRNARMILVALLTGYARRSENALVARGGREKSAEFSILHRRRASRRFIVRLPHHGVAVSYLLRVSTIYSLP
jgi:hypothetical protein